MEVANVVVWCQVNQVNLSLNVDKAMEMIVDYRRSAEQHKPLLSHQRAVERVNTFRFLGVSITEDPTWSHNTPGQKGTATAAFPTQIQGNWDSSQNCEELLQVHD